MSSFKILNLETKYALCCMSAFVRVSFIEVSNSMLKYVCVIGETCITWWFCSSIIVSFEPYIRHHV